MSSTDLLSRPDHKTVPTETAPTIIDPAPLQGGAPRRFSGKTAAIVTAVALCMGAGGVAIGRMSAPSTAAAPAADAPAVVASDGVGEAAVFVEKGLAAHVAGQLDDAVMLYEQAIELDPTNKYAHFNVGQIAHTRDDLTTAIDRYQDALAIDPAYGPALYNLGLAFSGTGKTTEAIATLRKAEEANPEDAKVLFNLGKLLLADGKADEGDALMAKAVAIDPALQALRP